MTNEVDNTEVLLTINQKYPSIFRRYFKVDPKQVTREQAREWATRYPVFSVEIAAADHEEASSDRSGVRGDDRDRSTSREAA